ncbi:phosphonoacetate hydrolase [Tepidicella baoligensis]|uniref:phosphonoacetate hydrolase n=1 Tax=Tepidicella baoligensis TaxID=2707016 RepID=UPI0015D993D7|nr:phosphonoacetate hydrolase [Tepidicella baoligensis]
MNNPVTANGRAYAWPQHPTVVICVDGCEPAYIEQAIAAGLMPNLKAMLARGTDLRADCVVPSFTNPNNLSIVTGVPPAVHGICGNYFIDPASGEEVMMNDPTFLRCGTLLAAFAAAGARIAIVTAKDKLRTLLGHGLPMDSGRVVCFSSEKADRTSVAEHGIADALGFVGLPLPSVYSAELSEFVFAAGCRLLESAPWDLMYLSTSDYIQHKHAPGTPVANAFYAMMDGYLGRLDALGATIAITADHGMKPKHDDAGRPNVVYLQPLLDEWVGADHCRVVLPITDPYVVHHGALGSFAVIHLTSLGDTSMVAARLRLVTGVNEVLERDEACVRFGLPPDREGELIVISESDWTLGTRPDRHDLSQLKEPLRSHGGTSEQRVPLLLNRRSEAPPADRKPRNFDAFSLALNRRLD